MIIGHKNSEVIIHVEELSPGTVIIQTIGDVSSKDTEKMFSFLKNYSKKIEEKITILYDISNIKSISREALLWISENIKDKSPVKEMISFGRNPFMLNLIQILIAIILEDDNIHKIFRNREEAISYLEKDILNLTPSSQLLQDISPSSLNATRL